MLIPARVPFPLEVESHPRNGEYLSKDASGYFDYFHVVEVWHREEAQGGLSALPARSTKRAKKVRFPPIADVRP